MRRRELCPLRQVRAHFDSATITVYQAYSPGIADAALGAGTFVPPFKFDRMTWIKPSFSWMMYRSGWATKPGQERILAVNITRDGFEDALARACLSHFDPAVYADWAAWTERKRTSDVRVQWDPERNLSFEPLPWRSLQVGLAGDATRQYVYEWIVRIDDVTDVAEKLRQRDPDDNVRLPIERPYPLPDTIAQTIGATPS